MPPEDKYRIEQWTGEHSELIATLATTATSAIAMAAWHAAIRTTPGAFLQFYSGRSIVDRIRTPGSPPDAEGAAGDGKAEAFDATIGDLASWHVLRAFCLTCSREKRFDQTAATKMFGPATRLSNLEKRLRCRACPPGSVQLQIHTQPR